MFSASNIAEIYQLTTAQALMKFGINTFKNCASTLKFSQVLVIFPRIHRFTCKIIKSASNIADIKFYGSCCQIAMEQIRVRAQLKCVQKLSLLVIKYVSKMTFHIDIFQMSDEMPLYVNGSHKLSRFRKYDTPIICGGKPFTSLESAYWYSMCLEQPYPSNVVGALENDDCFTEQPGKIRAFLSKRDDFEMSADLVMNTYNIWLDILYDQILQGSAFSTILKNELGQYNDPGTVEIVACEANTEMNMDAFVYTSACKKSSCERFRAQGLPYSGFNMWGELLKEATKIAFRLQEYKDDDYEPVFGVNALFGNNILNIQPSHKFTLLILSDGMLLPISIVDKGDILAIPKGAIFGDLVDIAHEKHIRLEDFHAVMIYGGINDCQQFQWLRDRSLNKLHYFLCVENANYTGDIVVCPTFNHPRVPQSADYADIVVEKFAGTNVQVADWSDGNPFIKDGAAADGCFIPSDNFHLTGTGVRYVYKECAKFLPDLRQVGYSLYPHHQSGHVIQFRPDPGDGSQMPSTSTGIRSTVFVGPGSRKRRIID